MKLENCSVFCFNLILAYFNVLRFIKLYILITGKFLFVCFFIQSFDVAVAIADRHRDLIHRRQLPGSRRCNNESFSPWSPDNAYDASWQR